MKATQQILDLDVEILDKATHAKELSRETKDIVEGKDEFKLVQTLAIDLSIAKAKLKIALMEDSGYNNLMEKLADDKETLHDLKDIMSAHLIEYIVETKEMAIDLGDGDARLISTRATLGKPEAANTIPMFAAKMGERSYELRSSESPDSKIVIDSKGMRPEPISLEDQEVEIESAQA